MELFIVTYQGGVVLAREVLHELQPLERNKYEYVQVEFDPSGRVLVSSCRKINSSQDHSKLILQLVEK